MREPPPSSTWKPQGAGVFHIISGVVVVVLAVAAVLLEEALGAGRGLVIGSVALTLVPSFLRSGGPRFHPLDPETLVPSMFFLGCGYTPMIELLFSSDFKLHDRDVETLWVALVGSTACALVAVLASRVPRKPDELPSESPQLRVTSTDQAAIVTGLIGAAMVGVFILQVGFVTLTQMSYGDTYLAEQEQGSLTAGWFVIQLEAAYLTSRCIQFRRASARIPRLLLWTLLLFILAFTFNTYMGRRGPLVWLFATMVLVAHLGGVVLRRMWFVVALVAIVFYGFVIEGMHANLGEDVDARVQAVQTRLKLVENPLVLPDLVAVWNNLAIVVNEKPELLDYPGESIALNFLMQVPKPLWRERPPGLAERLVTWYEPSLARAGGAYAFNAAAEGYLNFGLPGVVIEIVLVSYAFFGPLTECLRRTRSTIAQAFTACFVSYSYALFRAEIAAITKLLVALGAAVLVMFLIRNLFFVRREAWHQAHSERQA